MKATEKEKGYQKAKQEIEHIIQVITDSSPLPAIEADAAPKFTCNVTKDQYCAMVEKQSNTSATVIFFRLLSPDGLKRSTMQVC